LHRLALNHDPPYLYLLNSWDYGCEPTVVCPFYYVYDWLLAHNGYRSLFSYCIACLPFAIVNILVYCIECVLSFIFSIISFYTLTFSFTLRQIIQYWIKLEGRNDIFTQAATLFRTNVPVHRAASWFLSASRCGVCYVEKLFFHSHYFTSYCFNIYTYIYIHTHIYIHIYIYTHAHTHPQTHTHTHTHTHAHTYIYIYIYIYICFGN
jgi:hypothetical protein